MSFNESHNISRRDLCEESLENFQINPFMFKGKQQIPLPGILNFNPSDRVIDINPIVLAMDFTYRFIRQMCAGLQFAHI